MGVPKKPLTQSPLAGVQLNWNVLATKYMYRISFCWRRKQWILFEKCLNEYIWMYCLGICVFILVLLSLFQGSADSNYSQPSSDLSLDEEKESLRREKERQALSQLDKARVSPPWICIDQFYIIYTSLAEQTSSVRCANQRSIRWSHRRRFARAGRGCFIRDAGVSAHQGEVRQ